MTELSRGRILIVDLRSQLTNNIERINRELGYRSVILSPKNAGEWLRSGTPTEAIILSGGNFSVYEKDAPQPPEEIFTAKTPDGGRIPILGICYGHQWLAHKFGGQVAAIHPEHGHTIMRVCVGRSVLFEYLPDEQRVWMNHGDTVTEAPPGFRVMARSRDNNAIAAMENTSEGIFGVQPHPEATQTEFGPKILGNFLKFCECRKDWQPSSMIDAIRGAIDNEVQGGIVAGGVSGGVDSTVAMAIAAPVLGKRLHGFTIDANHLRLNELDEIKRHVEAANLLNHRVIDMRHTVVLFAGVTDAQKKRKDVFQNGIYVPGTVNEVRRVGATHFLQGSLVPDFIESGATGGETIKTHHNIGIDVNVPQLHPLSTLFKYEVRVLAERLGLPESVSQRKPFPGPGLFIRIVGIPVSNSILDCLRIATHEVERILQSDQKFWREEVSQPVVGYFGTPTVGQKGDKRVYSGSIVTRVVKTLDYMTAEGVEIPPEMRREIKRVVTKHPLVTRALFDETDKPPGTTEFE